MDLKLPSSYEKLSNAEQANIIGGGINLTMSRNFLDKSYCSRSAFTYIKYSNWTNISEESLKKELYAHAYVYYNWSIIEHIPGLSSIYNSAADGIYIEDKEDERQPLFDMIWGLPN